MFRSPIDFVNMRRRETFSGAEHMNVSAWNMKIA